ncbi:unnamed protein product [Closterium sp. NIES-64]|nr:unnamed protein product [Closterium sp. NIES-64]CAI5980940.1 unnamed protein product [Closterium sp. NIES-64]CAI5991011.1 unnamed protein product [Closterium sp. NIES-65]
MGLWDPILSRPSPDITASYEFLEEIGHGGSSVVRVCRHRATGERFACKSILKDNLRCAADVADVRREIEVLEQLGHHAHIVQLHATFEDISAVHLVMQLCHGGELFHEIVRRERFSEADAAVVFRQLAEAVAFCHARGVLHRDLKPENILLLHPVAEGEGGGGAEAGDGGAGERGNAAVAAVEDWKPREQADEEGNDGGLSPLEQNWPESSVTPPNHSPHLSQSSTPPPGNLLRHSSLPSPSSSAFPTSPLHYLPTIADPATTPPTSPPHSASASACPPSPSPPPPPLHVKLADFGLALHLGPGERAQGFAGSPFYVAPEVLARRSYDTSADMWSLGVVLYSLLAGDLPFVGDTEKKVFRAITKGRLNLQAPPWPSVSAPAKALIRRLLDPTPASRLSAPLLLQHPWLAHTPLPTAPALPVPQPVGAREGEAAPMGASPGRPGADWSDERASRAGGAARPASAGGRVAALQVPDPHRPAPHAAPQSPRTPSPRRAPPPVSAARSAASAAASALRKAARHAVSGGAAGAEGESEGPGDGAGEASGLHSGTGGGTSGAAGAGRTGGSAGNTPNSAMRSLAAAFGRSPGAKTESAKAEGGKSGAGQSGGVGSGTKRIVKALFRSLSSLASDYRRGRLSSLGLGGGTAGAEGEGGGKKAGAWGDWGSASGSGGASGAKGGSKGSGVSRAKEWSSGADARVPGRASFSSSSSSAWDGNSRGNGSSVEKGSGSNHKHVPHPQREGVSAGSSDASGGTSSSTFGGSASDGNTSGGSTSVKAVGEVQSTAGSRGSGSANTAALRSPVLCATSPASVESPPLAPMHAAPHGTAHAAAPAMCHDAHVPTDPVATIHPRNHCPHALAGTAADANPSAGAAATDNVAAVASQGAVDGAAETAAAADESQIECGGVEAAAVQVAAGVGESALQEGATACEVVPSGREDGSSVALAGGTSEAQGDAKGGSGSSDRIGSIAGTESCSTKAAHSTMPKPKAASTPTPVPTPSPTSEPTPTPCAASVAGGVQQTAGEQSAEQSKEGGERVKDGSVSSEVQTEREGTVGGAGSAAESGGESAPIGVEACLGDSTSVPPDPLRVSVPVPDGTADASTAVAGSAVAGTAVAGTAVAGSAVAGSAVAGSAVAGSAVAGSSAGLKPVTAAVALVPPGVSCLGDADPSLKLLLQPLRLSPRRSMRRSLSSSSSSSSRNGEVGKERRGALMDGQGQENVGGGGGSEQVVQACAPAPFKWRPLKGSLSGRLGSGRAAANVAPQLHN